jgi:PAS domain S-box-containing protein
LRASEERFRIASLSISDVVWEWDIDTGKLDWFGDIDRLLGYAQGEFPRTIEAWEALIAPEDRDRVMKALDHHLSTGDPYSQEYRVRRKDGSIAYWQDRGIAVRNEQAKAVRMFGAVTDITERRRAEEEIRKLNAELEQRVVDRTAQLEAANKELEAFSYSVSHDLRAPLRAIDSFSRIVLEEYANQLDAEASRLLNIVRSNTRTMDQLITDLLALSRVTRSEMQFSRIDMTTLAHSIYHEVASPEVQKKFVFSVAPLADAFGDPTLMRLVWSNLLSNAIKYTMPKDERIVQVGGRTEQGMNIYYVRDSGVGFDPNYTHKLFGVFQRLHKTEEFDGTGVGLAIVQRIIHRHGGRAWAEGKINAGATFYFSLPKKEAEHEQSE